MERARATWTDERLDDLSRRVDAGFSRVDDDLRQLRTEMNARFEFLEGRLGNRLDAVEGRVGAASTASTVRCFGSAGRSSSAC